ncbi:MAG TPA: hypothetical protein VFQ45_12685 [Longimicrobium sp.]|nr:hypothetical protein [Longimicrobium sp.]
MKSTEHRRTPRVLAVAAALMGGLLLGAPARAQQDPPRPPHEHGPQDMQRHMDQMVAHMTEHLQLTADQATRIRGILAETGRQMHAFHERMKQSGQAHPPHGPGHEPPAEMRALHDRTMQQIDAVLTESQRARFAQLREEMHKRHGAGPHPGGHHGPGGHGQHREGGHRPNH